MIRIILYFNLLFSNLTFHIPLHLFCPTLSHFNPCIIFTFIIVCSSTSFSLLHLINTFLYASLFIRYLSIPLHPFQPSNQNSFPSLLVSSCWIVFFACLALSNNKIIILTKSRARLWRWMMSAFFVFFLLFFIAISIFVLSTLFVPRWIITTFTSVPSMMLSMTVIWTWPRSRSRPWSSPEASLSFH